MSTGVARSERFASLHVYLHATPQTKYDFKENKYLKRNIY